MNGHLKQQKMEYKNQNDRVKDIFRVKEVDIFDVAHQYFGIIAEAATEEV